MSNKKSGVYKFLTGLGIGAGLGILFAPKSGSETRRELKNKLDEFVAELKNIDINEVKDEFLLKVEEIKKELDDLDKEKVLRIAKEKSEDLKEKVEYLVILAKDKGTPILEGIADDLRVKASNVIKEVLKKLDDKQ